MIRYNQNNNRDRRKGYETDEIDQAHDLGFGGDAFDGNHAGLCRDAAGEEGRSGGI